MQVKSNGIPTNLATPILQIDLLGRRLPVVCCEARVTVRLGAIE